MREIVVATCLAVTKANNLSTSHDAYALASALCESGVPQHYTLALAKLRSSELRKHAEYDESDRIIQEALHKASSGVHSRYWQG